MNLGRLFIGAVALAMACLLVGCGGGSNAAVTTPRTPPVASASGSDKFLLFPNSQQASQSSTLQQTNSMEYAQAYYAAIDPDNKKDTLEKWKAENGFGTGGNEVTVVFGDTRDLGYGRRMTARRNPATGDIAFIVENYQVDPGGAYGYSPVSLEAAVREDTRWRILINAIEYSPTAPGGVGFAKFFNFNAATGVRELQVDLDGRGRKFMPGPCLTCHGGRGDALVPDLNGTLQFPVVRNSRSLVPGDTQAHFAPLEVDHFNFSPLAGYTRSAQEAKLKMMNMFILCSYPMPTPPATAPTGVPTNFCVRPTAVTGEWQGTAADLLIKAYGGDGLPQPNFSDTFVPPDWEAGLQRDLYTSVIVPSCRACHLLRGTLNQSDIDFTTLAKFQSYAKSQTAQEPQFAALDDRIKVHVIDRADMPLAKIVFDTFWSSANRAILGTFLKDRGFIVLDASGAVPQPGRPVADPGPDRVITRGPTQLSAAASLFASAFVWTVETRPNGPPPSLGNANSAQPVFDASVDGTYTLKLIASNGTIQSAPAILTLSVQGQGPPARVTFANIKAVLGPAGPCASCHSPDGTATPPVFFADRQAGLVERTDTAAFYAEVRSRINFTDIVASPLLRKPAGHHHNGISGSPVNGFDDTKVPGEAGRESYDLFVNWILADAPLN